MLLGLAWRNLWRRPQRTVLSLISIVLVTALLVFVLAFQIGVYGSMKETTLRIFDGYAQVQPVGYAADPTLDRVIDGPEGLARDAERLGGVTTASPRVNGFAILANGSRSYAAAVIGVDPARDARISTIATRMTSGRYLAPGASASAILGDVLARNLGVGVGGKVTLLGSARDGSVAADVLTVAGIYHSGIPDFDRSIMEMPLGRAQDTFGMQDSANTIALGGPSLDAVDNALPALRTLSAKAGVAVRDWQQMEPAMRDYIQLKWVGGMVFYGALLIVVAFIVLNTLLMSVLERTREFGMMQALGMRSGQIGMMVWIELLMLALIGCAIGIGLGALLTLAIEQKGIEYPIDPKLLAQFGLPHRLYPQLTTFALFAAPAVLVAGIAVGGIVPYLRILRSTPAIAMRAA